jgi:hypothetical protein
MRILVFVLLVLLIPWVLFLFSDPTESNSYTLYQLTKTDPGGSSEPDLPEWMPGGVTHYKIQGGNIVQRQGSYIDKYEDCTVFDEDQWECTYSDGSGSFGVRNGDFWRRPEWDGWKEVSRFQFMLKKCEWWFLEGPAEGALMCYLSPFIM